MMMSPLNLTYGGEIKGRLWGEILYIYIFCNFKQISNKLNVKYKLNYIFKKREKIQKF